ncbi:MAG: hypothetical protein ACRCW4_14545 [Candidatus Neomicrothrix subdominans]
MATATQVTQDYRRALGLAATGVAQEIGRRLRPADTADIDSWWESRHGQVERVVSQAFTVTSALAVQYLLDHAATAGAEVELVEVEPDRQQIATALRVVGPVGFKTQLRRSGSTDAALRIMIDRTTGASRRLALDGARRTTMATIESAPQIRGYRRVTGASPCKFCEMLAGRGAVYLTEARASTTGATGRQRGSQPAGRAFHDHCSCTTEPVWGSPDGRRVTPPGQQEFMDQPAPLALGGDGESPSTPGRTGVSQPGPDQRPTKPAKKAQRPTKPAKKAQRGRRLNAGDLTEDQGRQIAASALRANRGDITMAQHRKFVRGLTGTDSRGRPRSGPPLPTKASSRPSATPKKKSALPPKKAPLPKVKKVTPVQRPRPLRAGDLTQDQGRQIANAAARMERGEISPVEYRKFVRELTNTDSRHRPRQSKA